MLRSAEMPHSYKETLLGTMKKFPEVSTPTRTITVVSSDYVHLEVRRTLTQNLPGSGQLRGDTMGPAERHAM